MTCIKCNQTIVKPLEDRRGRRTHLNPYCSSCRQDPEANRQRAAAWNADPTNKARRNLRLQAKRKGVTLTLSREKFLKLGSPASYGEYLKKTNKNI